MHLPNVVGHQLHKGSRPGTAGRAPSPALILPLRYLAQQWSGWLAETRSVSALARCRSSALQHW